MLLYETSVMTCHCIFPTFSAQDFCSSHAKSLIYFFSEKYYTEYYLSLGHLPFHLICVSVFRLGSWTVSPNWFVGGESKEEDEKEEIRQFWHGEVNFGTNTGAHMHTVWLFLSSVYTKKNNNKATRPLPARTQAFHMNFPFSPPPPLIKGVKINNNWVLFAAVWWQYIPSTCS